MEQFAVWLYTDRHSPSYTYYRGFLMRDRSARVPATTDRPVLSLPVGPIHDLANAVWRAYLAGKVTLVQHKLGAGEYEYIAQRLHP